MVRGICSKWVASVSMAIMILVATSVTAQSTTSAAAASADKQPSVQAAYQLGAGDTLRIEVFGEPELSVQVKVGDAGKITYPFLGQMTVSGLSLRELEQKLTADLQGDYLVDPKVSVSIVEHRPFFINGQVKSPGSFPFAPGMTVRKAISLAGGLTERASGRRITLIAETEREERAKGRAVSMDDPIRPGDIVTVEESFF
jgi:polysaccharide biosynthesis/export protein VpsN